MILFSIIIPIYNTDADILKKCIDSLLQQENFFGEYEVIIINDGSTNLDTNLFFNNIKNKKIRKITLQTNSGTARARQVGLSYSKGSYICFVDSDDNVDKNYLIIISNMIYKSYPDVIFLNSKDSNDAKNIGVITGENIFKKGQIYWTMWSMVIKKKFIVNNKVKIINPNWTSILENSFLEDLYFFIQIISVVNLEKILMITEKIYFYNKNNNSMTNTKISKIDRTYMRMRNIIDGYNIKTTNLTKKNLKNIFFGRRVFFWTEKSIKKNSVLSQIYYQYIELNIPKIWYKVNSLEFIYKIYKLIKFKK